jgi:hypothetical protein
MPLLCSQPGSSGCRSDPGNGGLHPSVTNLNRWPITWDGFQENGIFTGLCCAKSPRLIHTIKVCFSEKNSLFLHSYRMIHH